MSTIDFEFDFEVSKILRSAILKILNFKNVEFSSSTLFQLRVSLYKQVLYHVENSVEGLLWVGVRSCCWACEWWRNDRKSQCLSQQNDNSSSNKTINQTHIVKKRKRNKDDDFFFMMNLQWTSCWQFSLCLKRKQNDKLFFF